MNLGLWSASLGLGYNHTIQGDRQLNDQTGKVGHFVHQQVFGSIKHPLFVPQLTAKLVVAWARADLQRLIQKQGHLAPSCPMLMKERLPSRGKHASNARSRRALA